MQPAAVDRGDTAGYHPVGARSTLPAVTGSTPEVPRVRPLSAREANLPPDNTLYEAVPVHLEGPLQSWVVTFFITRDWFQHRVAATLRVQQPTGRGKDHRRGLWFLTGMDLLDAVDVGLQLDTALHAEIDDGQVNGQHGPDWPSRNSRAEDVEKLDEILADGGSAYQVHWQPPTQLVRRVDPIVVTAVQEVLATAEPTAAELMWDAWRKTYGVHPDPTAAYRQVVRALEHVACPLVLPKEEATLGKVIGHLKQGAHKWRFVLVDKDDDGSVAPLVQLLDRIWTGQVSRHGGGKRSRDQTQEEAVAAFHMAVTVVQLLSSRSLTPR
jgi:hypothetical protein